MDENQATLNETLGGPAEAAATTEMEFSQPPAHPPLDLATEVAPVKKSKQKFYLIAKSRATSVVSIYPFETRRELNQALPMVVPTEMILSIIRGTELRFQVTQTVKLS